MKIRLNYNLYVQPHGDGVVLHLPDDEVLKIQEKDYIADVLSHIKEYGALGSDTVYEMLVSRHALTHEEFDDILKQLIDSNIAKIEQDIPDTISKRNLQKFDRQLKSFATIKGNSLADAIYFQEKLMTTKVGVLGVGGVGSYVAYGLTCMGIGYLKLIDHDHIELSNTSRQMLYDESDVGKLKVEVAKQKLSLVNTETNITTVNKKITCAKDLETQLSNLDILILCADTPRGKIVYIVDDACQAQSVPFICGSPMANQIFCGPLIIPGQTRRYRDIFPEPANEKDDNLNSMFDYINQDFVATIIDPYNAIAAKIVVLEVVKHLTSFQPCQVIDNVVTLDTNTWQSQCYSV